MNESLSGVMIGILGAVGLTYLAVKVRQNQRRLRRTVGIIDSRYTTEMKYLFELADSGQIKLYQAQPMH
jgi:hypothetical protein